MKVAILTDGFYPFVTGGMQRHSYFLIKYLARKKVHLRVYFCIQNDLDFQSTIQKIFSEEELQYIEFVEIPFNFKSLFPGFYLIESYLYSKRIYEHLIKDITAFDFIYSKGFTAWYLLKHKQNDFPKIGVKLHGYEMYQYAPDLRTKLQHYLLRIPAHFVTKNADVVFSYGGKITDILMYQLGVQKAKIVELPTGIEKELIQKEETEYHQPIQFVFVGRYEKRKGIENIHQAIKKLLEEKKTFQFHFIGEIPQNLKIENEQVIYHGLITEYTKISEILRSCDVLLCPSYSEGMPNVIVEGMANGLTVIASDVGAVSLLVNDKTGYLLENNDVENLYIVMNRVISEKKEVLQSKKKAALEHIQNFVWEKISDRLLEEIRKLSLPR
ncbi:MAG: glycosyltransferase family 4 protein [Bacteroidota bacterium]